MVLTYCFTQYCRAPLDKDLDRPSVVLAATATGTAGIIVFALLPILVGQIAESFNLDDVQTGFTASAYFTVYALVSLSAPVWIRRFNWRYTTIVATVTMIGGLTALEHSQSFQGVVVAMAVTGAGAAALLPISLTLVSDMREMERAYAITITLEQLVPAVLLLGISAAWFGAYELGSTTYLIGAVVVICFLLSFSLPAHGRVVNAVNDNANTSSWLAIVSLVGLALNFAGFAAMWAFIERIAIDSGLEANFAAFWIAVGLFMTALGPMISAWLGDRAGRLKPMVIPTLAAMLSSFLIAGDVTSTTYAAMLVVFPLTYYIALSFILSVIADADPNGSLASLMSFALACGALAGPGFFGYLRGSGAELWLIVVALGGGVAILGWVDIQNRARKQASHITMGENHV